MATQDDAGALAAQLTAFEAHIDGFGGFSDPEDVARAKVGPVEIPGLEDERDSMPSEVGDVLEELDLEAEEDRLSNLFALQSFCMLQADFHEA